MSLAAFEHRARALHTLLERLNTAYAVAQWWPAESPFEVMIGAVLTQNTTWRNVERALAALRAAVAFDEQAILALPPEELAGLLRPAGYYRLKAERLRSLCAALHAAGGWQALAARDTQELRDWLLAIRGVGPETADDILLYGFARAVFVADAYSRRLLSRYGVIAESERYEAVRGFVEQVLGEHVPELKRAHALMVEHGKARCRARPRCHDCLLHPHCALASQTQSAHT